MKITEEKAKAYDEAVNKIKPLYEQAKRDGNPIWSTYEYLIPELRESEDERIRKYLISELKVANSVGELKFSIPQPTREECISYLERQKEQKPIQTDAEREYVRTLKSLVADFVRANNYIERGYYQQIYDWLDGRHVEQEEQKSAEKQDYSGLTDFERAIHRGFLCVGVENVPVTIIKETAQDCLAHIKPVELKYWDKEMIQSIISILERDNCFKVVDEKPMRIFAHEQEINYLRNLQEYLYPNPHWKPSEEQMRALGDYIDGEEISEYDMEEIVRLYHDLEKL